MVVLAPRKLGASSCQSRTVQSGAARSPVLLLLLLLLSASGRVSGRMLAARPVSSVCSEESTSGSCESRGCDSPRHSNCPRLLRSNAARHLLSGAIAGVVSNTVVAPLDIMRLNLMVAQEQRSILSVARSIYAQGGLLAFWRGNTADVLRTIPSSAVRFYSFAVYKAQLPAALAAMGAGADLATVSLLAGGFAGMSAMALLFPLETVRTQMATRSSGGVSLLAFSRELVRTDGVRGLYRGLPTSLVSVMPYFGIRFGAYDILKRAHTSAANGSAVPSHYNAAYGFAAGFAASGLTFPMEVVRRRAMVGAISPNPLVALPAIIRAEGVAGLYKGYGVNVVKVS